MRKRDSDHSIGHGVATIKARPMTSRFVDRVNRPRPPASVAGIHGVNVLDVTRYLLM